MEEASRPPSHQNFSVQEQRRQLLRSEFERRKSTNARYSQRALARDLNVSHSLLSLILSGKREMSAEFTQALIEASALPLDEIEVVKAGLPQDLPDSYERLELEKFEMIADWIHYAILSLLETPNSQWEPSWVAVRLGQPISKIRQAMARLEQLGFVKKLGSGRWQQATAPLIMENKRSSAATKLFNRRLLNKAIDSMETCDFEERDLSSTTFTLNPRFIPYAIERIQNFRRSLTNELENLGEQTAVYALTVQLFPLSLQTKEDKMKEEN